MHLRLRTKIKEGIIMQTTQIVLASVEDVRKFVTLASECDFDVTLVSGKYRIDGKSIMGVFSLNLSNPITVEVESDHAGDFMEKIKAFAPQK